MRSKIYSFFSAAAAALLLLPSPEAAAQFTIYSGGDVVYTKTSGQPDSVVFDYPVLPVKASQEKNFETVGGAVPKASEAVDLGLSVKWAPWNLGAESAAEAGAYFAWGEVQAGKESYDWSTYWWMAEGESGWEHITKYLREDSQTSADWYYDGLFIGDGKTTLEAADDAATANWGGKWRMPTQAELQELSGKCAWTWKDENEYAEGSLAGYLVTGPNGNSIFLPAAGYRWYSGLYRLGSYGYYWSSELTSGYSDFARSLDFYSDDRSADLSSDFRYRGFSVRAVLSAAE